jgi:hypothetical protein
MNTEEIGCKIYTECPVMDYQEYKSYILTGKKPGETVDETSRRVTLERVNR